MRLLVVVAVAFAVTAGVGAPPGRPLLDAVAEIRAERHEAGRRVGCERQALRALTSEDAGELRAAQRACERIWGSDDPRLPAELQGP